MMSCAEIAVAATVGASAFFGGLFLGRESLLGSALGSLAGLAVGCTSLIVLSELLAILARVFGRYRPFRPACKNGLCHSDDYEIASLYSKHLGGVVFRCRCGDEYLSKDVPGGAKFMLLVANGSPQPCMRRQGMFGRWEPDNVPHAEGITAADQVPRVPSEDPSASDGEH
jgi:hypothetical protein